LDTLPSKTIIQSLWSNKNPPRQTETKTIYDYQATTTEDSTRNSAHRIQKQTKPWEGGKHQTTGEEKTSNQKVA
jgi:hypothetical protein